MEREHEGSDARASSRLRRRVAIAVSLVVASCVGGRVVELGEGRIAAWRSDQGAQHEWWSERGLVIPHASFPADCRLCHLPGSWNELRPDFSFDHEAETGYALEGAHASAQCLRCHNDRGAAEDFAARGCVGCHVDVHQGQRGSGCSDCHGTEDWSVDADWLAHARTRFPLIGPHAAASCRDCHVGIDAGVLEPLDTACASCHTDDLARALDPNHRALGWTARCDDCHSVSTFGSAGFLHPGFPLTAGHASLSCNECHAGGQFAGLSSQCSECHIDDYQAASNPPHAQLGFPLACQQCHTTSAWPGGAFEHSSFELTGAHRLTSCNGCHGGGVFAGTPTACVACHQGDYNASTNPPHAALGFPTSCQDCHGTSAWPGTTFAHTAFPLTGAHASASCNGCHGGGVFAGTPAACVACHQAEYNATRNPPHASLGFPTSCQDCHGTSAWPGAAFAHTTFPLTGAHAATSCNACHGGGVFAGTPQTCFACHESDYNAATNPNHAALGFPTSCQDCHTTQGWPGATFAHSTFPLTGAHASASCNSCHGGGVFAGTPQNCVACHLAEYNATTDPNHSALGFPTSCQDCHTTQGWPGAVFQHVWFPIVGGNHGGLSCNECHQVPGNPNVFSCIHCHEHRQSEMDDEHEDVPGYVYSSPACYQCHPNGEEHARLPAPTWLPKRRPDAARPKPGPTPDRDAPRRRGR